MSGTVPHDADAEAHTLGACLLTQSAFGVARRIVSDDDWYLPAHELIWAAILTVVGKGQVPDMVSVLAELQANGTIGKAGGPVYLHTIVSNTPTTVNVDYWAERISDRAVLRRLLAAGVRIQQMAEGAASGAGMVGTTADAVSRATEEVALVTRMSATPVTDLHTWQGFLTQPRQQENWIIPGLIARQDVIMVLGGEGSGKSFLSRQIAQCLAAGIHPFRPREQIQPHRTLTIDLEVSQETLMNEAGDMSRRIADLGDWDPDLSYVWHHPQGLNLRDSRDAMELERRIAQCRPDFVSLGSLYNAYQVGKDSAEQVAGELRSLFNRLRVKYGFALLLEHHMPQTDQAGNRPNRPYGSVQWAGWVTHGKVLKFVDPKTYEIGNFRNDRGLREWPAGITRGGILPVTPVWDATDLDLLRDVASNPGRPAAVPLRPVPDAPNWNSR